jgi:hypothetical protein
MRVIDDHDELVALCGGDTLCLWAAQGLSERGRAWASDDGWTLAVAGTGISRRDRLVVGSAALMVDEWNQAAVRLYQSLGMRYRPTRAAYVARPFTT